MRIRRERLAPYLKWGLIGLFMGAIVGSFLFRLLTENASGFETAKFALVGGFTLMLLFLGITLFKDLWYEASSDVQLRKAAEAHDPHLVHGLLVDIKDGEEGAAWSAIALLANYRDPETTEKMLNGVLARLENRKVLTMDRYAILRHAIKAVQNTRSVPNTSKLKLLLSNDNPEVSSMAIRLGVGSKTQSDATLR